jgi:hypothetical protein
MGALPLTIYLYDEGTSPALDLHRLAERLSALTGARCFAREEFVTHQLGAEGVAGEAGRRLAAEIARLRVLGWNSPRCRAWPTPLEVDVERRALLRRQPALGVAHDAVRLLWLFEQLLPTEEEEGAPALHIVFTRRMVATWDDGDKRWHARTTAYGQPCLISTTGLVEAPARPRAYYAAHNELASLAPADLLRARLEQGLGETILHTDDPRLTEVSVGYALQCIFYHLTGWPFCEDPNCRLYNAHWQAELIHAQLREGADLCEAHRRVLEERGGVAGAVS